MSKKLADDERKLSGDAITKGKQIKTNSGISNFFFEGRRINVSKKKVKRVYR